MLSVMPNIFQRMNDSPDEVKSEVMMIHSQAKNQVNETIIKADITNQVNTDIGNRKLIFTDEQGRPITDGEKIEEKKSEEVNARQREAVLKQINENFYDLLKQKNYLSNISVRNQYSSLYDAVWHWNPTLNDDDLGTEQTCCGLLQSFLMQELDKLKEEEEEEEEEAKADCQALKILLEDYQQHLQQRIISLAKQALPQKYIRQYLDKNNELDIDAVIGAGPAIYINPYELNEKKPGIKSNEALDMTLTKYQNIQNLLETLNLEKDEVSYSHKKLIFNARYQTKRPLLQENTQQWRTLAKKISAILSCIIGIGLYKAYRSQTYFGKSHGAVICTQVDKHLKVS